MPLLPSGFWCARTPKIRAFIFNCRVPVSQILSRGPLVHSQAPAQQRLARPRQPNRYRFAVPLRTEPPGSGNSATWKAPLNSVITPPGPSKLTAFGSPDFRPLSGVGPPPNSVIRRFAASFRPWSSSMGPRRPRKTRPLTPSCSSSGMSCVGISVKSTGSFVPSAIATSRSCCPAKRLKPSSLSFSLY